MAESPQATSVPCPSCGAASTDPQWCAHCGAALESKARPREWLQVGDVIAFDGLSPNTVAALPVEEAVVDGDVTQVAFGSRSAPTIKAEPEAEAEAPEDAWESNRTRLDIPVLARHFEESLGPGAGLAAGQLRPLEDKPAAASIAEAEAAFELLGPPEPAVAAPAVARADSTPAAPIQVPPEASLTAADPSETTRNSARVVGQARVRIVAQRESYAQRRLWDAVDVDDGAGWVVEERRLVPNESEAEAARFEPVDVISQRFLFNPVARRMHEGRVLTLYETPLGQSLESWRRGISRDAATPRAILGILRPLFAAVEEMHKAGRVHLHLNPRTIWLHQNEVGFTGVDQLEPLPVQRTRFRATVGFSAPEVFGRSKTQIDTAADIYSLGAVAYYLVAGVLPPAAPETAFAPALAPRDFRPSFPPGWSEAILRATDPSIARRYGAVRDFLDVLESGFTIMKARSAQDAPVVLAAEAETHIGYAKKKRSPVNQDSIFFAQSSNRRRMLLAVADGVSTATYGSGDLASGFLVKRVAQAWERLQATDGPIDTEGFLGRIINEANADICDYVNKTYGALKAGPSQVMGSTALVALVEDGLFTLASLGDSRAYLIRHDMMECITRDHNLFTISLVEGLSIDAVLAVPHGDALARCLGTFDLDREGFLSPVAPPFDLYRLRLIPGDNILLCTDGLFDYAGATYEESESNIKRIVLGESHPGIACLELILLANRGGGGDNIGTVLLKAFADGAA